MPLKPLILLFSLVAVTSAHAQRQRSDDRVPPDDSFDRPSVERPTPGTPETERRARSIEEKTPISVAGKKASPVVFARMRTTILNNESLGPREDGMFCRSRGNFVMGPKTWELVMRGAARAFRSELLKAGYPNPYASESAFDDNRRPATDFEVGATMQQARIKLCINGREAQGSVYVQTKWELYYKKARKVVFQIVTEGSYQNTAPEALGFTEWWERAFAESIRSVLAEPQFAEILTGIAALPAVAEAAASPERIVLPLTQVLEGGTAKNATLLRASVVTVNNGRGYGSGFFVSPQGYLLTNHHVVGDVKFVKVQLATGREVIGEVVRVDKARDVALVKTDAIGANPLPIRTSEPNVGEELYAIGSPISEKLSGTFTRGILSGHRVLGEQRYLQSDVTIMPGNSGGPLLDASARVVGMSVAGLRADIPVRGNLNFFIPIGDVLSSLQLQVQQ